MEPICVNTANLQVLGQGLVFIKGALSQDLQIFLANYALEAGKSPENGFWTTMPDGAQVLNSDTGRGRIYDTIDKFQKPGFILDLCQQLVSTAQQHDPKLPDMNPTHLLLLYYATADGMCWHSDSDKNDGNNDHPIVSITIGNSCDFGIKRAGKKEEFLRLDSGDVLIWGGPNRMLPHCVEKVYMGTCPSYLPIKDARLNFTYRDAPDVLGKEDLYKYNVQFDYTQLLCDKYEQDVYSLFLKK
eukprot:Phypoly_transcript_17043.p1 GENE.Phypoly_transcript_17043~~Phypoly_transcript_17043.p1  ORF type:complete len:243 (+),score=23.71 Phypoly_transcript_17043:91-819(+)